jgi:phosphoglycerate dehydrogenase-like enzyme
LRLGILGTMPDAYTRDLGRRFPDVELASAHDADYDVLVVWELDADAAVKLIEERPRLAWVHLRWAGVPAQVVHALGDRSTLLTNGSGAHGMAIGEYVVGVVLVHYKRFHEMRAAQQRSAWLAGFRIRELRGQTVGIIGLGDLGGSTARVLRPFGVRLRGLRRSAAPSADVDEVFTHGRLAEFLAGLDVLVVAAPLTDETRGLIGAAELARLTPGALLVNVGRAVIVDQAAMVDALASGQLGGAALDVFPTEPLAADSPLWQTPNVFISPHCADASPQSLERGLALFLDNIGRFQRGESLHNQVDRAAGY